MTTTTSGDGENNDATATDADAQKQKRKNLTQRVLSTALGVPFLTLAIFAEIPGAPRAIFYVVSGILFSGVAGIEFFLAARRHGYAPVTPIASVAIALLQLYAWQSAPPWLPFWLTLLFAILLTVALLQTVISKHEKVVVNLGVTLMGVAYTGWLFSYLIRIRSLPGIVTVAPWGETPLGAWLALFVFFVTFSADTAAFFVGRAFGRRPLAPRLSPKKTVEGSIGGVAGALLMATLIGNTIGFPIWKSLALGLVCSVLGQMGDLFASALKRDLNIKDFGGALPGMGGVLDRFDGILFSAPIAYYLLQLWH